MKRLAQLTKYVILPATLGLLMGGLATLTSAGAQAAIMPYTLPDTGQTDCYNSAGGGLTCPNQGDAMAQDGSYSLNLPAFTDHANGTVTDDNTGLMWQKANNGLAYNWFEASGTADASLNPGGAIAVCGNLALGGHTNWRLPTRRELLGILDFGTNFPALNTTIFVHNDNPDSPAIFYWSVDLYAPDTTAAWTVDSWDGFSWELGKSDPLGALVRCVRGDGLSTGVFTDNGDGTVTDEVTGLVWQQVDGGAMTWSQALGYCEALDFAGRTDWRLPNIKELETVVDLEAMDPAIDPAFSTGPPLSGAVFYWSSTTQDFTSPRTLAWTVEFTDVDGSVDVDAKTSALTYARCVRGGIPGPLGVFNTGAWTLDMNGNGTLDPLPFDAEPTWPYLPGDIPIVGDWDSDGDSDLGTFRVRDGMIYWRLDSNGNGVWDKPIGGDMKPIWNGWLPGDQPVIGDWDRDGFVDDVGVFRVRDGMIYWRLDANGNGVWNKPGGGDIKFIWNGWLPGDQPVVGDWDQDGFVDNVGVFRVRDGMIYWRLDANGNGVWDKPSGGDVKHKWPWTPGDQPVVGDWNRDGITDLGTTREAGGSIFWNLDMNGNGSWDTPAGGDATFSFGNVGDTPVVGNW